jgi:hypothetical protein
MLRRLFSSLSRCGPLLAIALLLGACTAGGQFDPTEVVSGDMFSTKKKLAGDREPLFPQGVPGAETGVPPDLVKGYQPPPEPAAAADNAAEGVAKAAAAAEKPKKVRPKPKVARASAPQAHDPVWDQKPPPSAQAPQTGQTAWPSLPSGQQTNWPAPPGQASQGAAATNWPAPPPTRQAQ